MAELRIMIADDHQLIRHGLRALLTAQSGWRVVGEACNGVEAVEMAVSLRPDIAILDFTMPKLNGPGAAAQILEKAPATSVIVLTMHDSEQVIRTVVQAGARGLVFKGDADRDLLGAVEAVSEHRDFFSAHVAELVVGSRPAESLVPALKGTRTGTSLTEREHEVMRLLAEGMTSKEAATHLRISTRTVESHRINISRKLGFGSIADLVRYAIRNGIVAHC